MKNYPACKELIVRGLVLLVDWLIYFLQDKLHDDAIGIMESQLHNLSATVTELTVKLDVLNKQVCVSIPANYYSKS